MVTPHAVPPGSVAVIGVACRLPAAPDPVRFWELLRSGREAVDAAPADRFGGDRPRGGFLDDVAGFDAGFFGVSPREAALMDPQQRLTLELCWEALEHARLSPDTLRGSRTGIFLGAMSDEYAALLHRHGRAAITPHTMTGLQRSLQANRISHLLGLRGPSLTVDSGQSSSLVATHLAVESLRRGESVIALVGGVNLLLDPDAMWSTREFGALSPDGHCYAFDSRANGFVRGEGGAVLVLKPAAAAIADGDRVLCLLLGSAVNNDGPAEGLTVPSRTAQEEVLREAYAAANVDPDDVQYVEAHGTGTEVGDPVEAAALGAVFGQGRTGHPLALGSVKTNVGHLEGGAGAVGLLKTVLAIAHRELPPSLNFATAHPRIPLPDLGLRVPTEHGPWPASNAPLVAGVSSFGMGGTNCHVVLSEAPAVPAPRDRGRAGRRVVPWVLSARAEPALRAAATRLSRHVGTADPAEPHPEDVGFSLATTRAAFEHRACAVGRDASDLRDGLAALADGERSEQVVCGSPKGGLALLFPGQGFQHPGMARTLHRTFPAFARAFDEVCAALDPLLPRPLRTVLWAADGTAELDQTQYTQPALFAVGVSLSELLASFGVRADAVAGHSVGEIAAAHVAGALSLADAARLVCLRGRLMQNMPSGGAMVSVQATEEEVAGLLGDRVALAAVNGPGSVVVSGDHGPVTEIAEHFTARGRRTKVLRTSHAFHSPVVDSILDELRAAADGMAAAGPPRAVVASTLTGRPVTAEELRSPEHWARHARRPVRFGDGITTLLDEGARVFLEAGPGHGLTLLGQSGAPADAAFYPCLDGPDEELSFVRALGAAYAHGAEVDWRAFFGAARSTVDLPTYPFQRERHWFDRVLGDESRNGVPEDVPGTDRTEGTERTEVARRVAGAGSAERERLTLDLVREVAADVLGHDSATAVSARRPFRDLGFDSRLTVRLVNRLADATGLPLPTALPYDHPTPERLARRLQDALADTDTDAARHPVPGAGGPHDDPIAIVAMSCRYPGDVHSPEELWQLVESGGDAITAFPDDRGWESAARYDSRPGLPGHTYTRHGGFLSAVDEFDAAFFGIGPREATAMDPQQRILLESAWELFERAGIDPGRLRDGPVGVFVGATGQEYGPRMHEAGDEQGGFVLTGTTPSVLSGRLSYFFDLTGPALTVDTACSSSLVTLHLAARSLRAGECTLAIAGGVTVMSSPGMFVEFSRQRGLAPDGRCKPFAAAADGTAWAEGAGLLLLEPLSRARRNGHRVLALLRGSATNQDGASNGLSAPNGPAQEAVIRAALADAALAPADVSAVEAHGTGTALGDPVEAGALLATYGQGRAADRPVWLGSVKSNIGHAQAAAGVAGVIKMVQAFRHGTVPATLHVDEPTPRVDWSGGTLALATRPVPWPREDGPRRVGVSSFGISGTNAHVILEEPPPPTDDVPAESGHDGVRIAAQVVPWVVSGRTPSALRDQAARLHPAVAAADPAAVGYALATTRPEFSHRAVVLGADRERLLTGTASLARGEPSPSVVTGRVVEGGTVFVFPGQGSQWLGMATEMLESSPVFAEKVRACAEAFREFVDWSLPDVLRGSPDAPSLDQVDVVQPALFAIMVALAAVWRAHGVHPDAVVGHSQGEIAAAHVAGALSLRDAARVVVLRARLLAELAGTGGMASVPLGGDEVRELMARAGGELHVAAVNGPVSTVVAGPVHALDQLTADCAARGIKVNPIDVDYASHGPAVEVLRRPLTEALEGLRPRRPDIPFYSTRTGEAIERELDTEYWYGNLRETVRFHDAVRALLAGGHRRFVEVSPHPVLSAGVQDTADDAGVEVVTTGTLRRDRGGPEQLLTALAATYTAGAPVDWRTVLPSAEPVDLPTYAFQRRRFRAPDRPAPARATEHPLLDTSVRLAGSDRLVCEGALSTQRQPWLADHAVTGQVLLPGTALLDLAAHAARMLGLGIVDDLVLEAPLPVPAEAATRVQVEAGPPDENGRRSLTIHSRPSGSDTWTRHAGGTLGAADTPIPATPPAQLSAHAEPLPVDGIYERLADRGYEYGPSFRLLRTLWRDGRDLVADVSTADQVPGFGPRPAMLDAALHALLGTGDVGGDGRLWLPFAWHGVTLRATDATTLRVRFTGKGEGEVAVTVTDGGTTPVATIGRLSFRASAPAPTDSMFTVELVPLHGTRPDPAPRTVMLGDDRWQGDTYPSVERFLDAVAVGEPVPDLALAPCPDGSGMDCAEAAHLVAEHVLTLIQRWLAEPRLERTPLAILTRPVLAHGAVPGLVRTAQAEHPDRFVLVETEHDPAEEGVSDLVEAAVSAQEPEVVVRAGALHARRLASAPSALRPPGDAPSWHLDTTSRGSLDGLSLVPQDHRPLGEHEVRIAVRAAGVNFRDVVIALDLLEHEELMGSEGAGVVAEVGPGVTDLAVGDRVLGVFERAFGPDVVTDRRTVAPVPEGWTFAQAAGVPVAFLTAYQCLVKLARLRPGEAVLIHAATGGVGMAAVQLARHLGAEVFATASPAKWPVLHRLGLDDAHIASSRSLEFAERFDGRIDVVLNSLTGRFVDASLGMLRSGGRFVEIGKTDIRSPQAVASAHPGVRYRTYNLLDVPPDRLGSLLTELLDLFGSGALTPLPVTALDVRRGAEALARLRDATHVGKLVLTIPHPFDPGGTVLITGGTGTLGAALARHLVRCHGATRLLLAGRRGPEAPGMAALRAELAELGADVDAVACDVADRDALARLISGMPANHRLTAVLHLAGTLEDATVTSLSRDALQRVLRPKVDAAWHLHELTRGMDLSAFVLFSSAVGVLGLPGQANYAAANTFLDALARRRRADGLPGLSLAWGVWAERSGMTGHLRAADLERLRQHGLDVLPTDEGLALFDTALEAAADTLVPLRLDAGTGEERPSVPALLRDVLPERRRGLPTAAHPETGPDESLAGRLPTMSHDERGRELLHLVRVHAATVLGYDGPEAVSPESAFKEIGFDSLTGVELRNRLKAAIGVAIPSTVVTDQTTAMSLSEHLAQAVGATSDSANVGGTTLTE
ncbi:acyl transferase domain-containing protein [Prauserella shujinwangii]|uniref:Acyl transferase domain-containing protein n=2 Tax=Prauserella shujinwangii TaxID=1453103 RepID=A0A2T0M3U4_9PSEU|nr:acyl transferase domain-containing protein [Prauserella shujinwangii]